MYFCYSKIFDFRTNQLSSELSVFNFGTDNNYLDKLTINIFNKYVDNYIKYVLFFFRDKKYFLIKSTI